MNKIQLLILFGGENTEYEISLRSTASILKNINKTNYDIHISGITKNGDWLYIPYTDNIIDLIENNNWYKDNHSTPCFISTSKSNKGIFIFKENRYQLKNIDVIFPIMHGKNAEDGTLQGLLEFSGIPYIGCKTTSSAICMNKVITNTILEKYNIHHTKWESISIFDNNKIYKEKLISIKKEFKLPIFVKPSSSGSSVGVSKVNNIDELEEAIKNAFKYDDIVLIEEGVIGRELEVAVFGIDNLKVSCVGEIVFEESFYSYDSKYISNKSQINIPAKEIDEQILEEIRKIALKAYRILGCSTLSRIDFFLEDKTNKIFLNEVNTMPGFTNISMYPKLFENDGIKYSDLIDMLISVNLKK